MPTRTHRLKDIIKDLLEKEVINLPIRLSVRSGLHSETVPLRLKKIILAQISCRIPISSIDQFTMKIFDGRKLVIGTPSKNAIANQLFWQGFRSRQPETTRVFYRLAKRASVIFDIGTNIGFYALLAAAINGRSKIFAFEPIPFIFKLLKTNITLNSFSHIIPVQKAAVDFDGRITFYVNLKSDSSGSMLKAFREIVQEIEVPAITLDTYVDQNNTGRVDLVKIDAEGADDRVLKGMQRILQRDKPDIICEVLCGRTEDTLQEILSDFSYKYYWITDDGLIPRDRIVGDCQFRYLNYLFTKNPLPNLCNCLKK